MTNQNACFLYHKARKMEAEKLEYLNTILQYFMNKTNFHSGKRV